MRDELLKCAKEALKYSCSKYSNVKVGAALLTKTGKIYKGCNIENEGIMSICAERTAFVKALSEGENKFSSIALVGEKNNEIFSVKPCGYCREFMNEYCDNKFKIITIDKEYTLEELLPNSFKM